MERYTKYKPAPNENASTKHRGLLAAVDKTKLNNLWTPKNSTGSQEFTDFNAIEKSGFYTGCNVSNAPLTPYVSYCWHLIHVEHIDNNDYSLQIATLLNVPNGAMYMRTRTGGPWSAWRVMSEDTGWVDATPYFTNGFSSWSGWPVSFRRRNGIVYFRGMITRGTSAGAMTIMTLPVGYYPPYQVMYRGAASADSGVLNIVSNVLQSFGGITASNWISLSGLSYPVD